MAASGGMDEFLKRFDAHLARQGTIIERIDGHMARQNEHLARQDEILERMDGHMAHQNEHLARQDEILKRIDGHMARQNEHMARQERLEERIVQAFDRNGRAWGHAVSAMSAIRESLDDMRSEIRAQTQAISRMIDRLDGGQQTA
jgi:chromosome segregation ATPase